MLCYIEFQLSSVVFKYSSRLRALKLTSITAVIRSTHASISGYLSCGASEPETLADLNTGIRHIDLLEFLLFLCENCIKRVLLHLTCKLYTCSPVQSFSSCHFYLSVLGAAVEPRCTKSVEVNKGLMLKTSKWFIILVKLIAMAALMVMFCILNEVMKWLLFILTVNVCTHIFNLFKL